MDCTGCDNGLDGAREEKAIGSRKVLLHVLKCLWGTGEERGG